MKILLLVGVAVAMAATSSALADPIIVTIKSYAPRRIIVDPAGPRTITYYEPVESRKVQKRRNATLAQAERGTAEEAYSLAMQYSDIKSKERDPALAVALFESAARRGHKAARRKLTSYSSDEARKQYWSDELARDGGVAEWLEAAEHYRQLEPDALYDARAVGWYTKAAETGDVKAQMWLAKRYTGTSDRRDVRLALHWYTRAADAGNPEAALEIGNLYMGEPAGDEWYGAQTDLRDPLLAIQWYARAAEKQDNKARSKLCEWPDQDTRHVYADALARCLAVVGQGYIPAQWSLRLATALFNGDPLPQDYATAWHLLRVERTPDALYYRARMKIDGLGTEAEPATGWFWMIKAAREGSPQAQIWLQDHPKPADIYQNEYDVSAQPIDDRVAMPLDLSEVGETLYPERAREDEIEDMVVVRCTWVEGRPAACRVIDKSVPGYGFEKATVQVIEQYGPPVNPSDDWKARSAGKWSDFEVRWTLN